MLDIEYSVITSNIIKSFDCMSFNAIPENKILEKISNLQYSRPQCTSD